MVKVHFDNIHSEIISQINKSNKDIRICIAWFTDYEIYESLVEKQKSGVNVYIIISNHEFNKRSRVDFKELLKYNGQIGYIGNINDGSNDSFMHNKFCIIDSSVIITGSYNWTFKARRNHENILVIKAEPDLVTKFTEKFNKFKPEFGFTIKGEEVTLMPIEKIVSKWDNTTSANIKYKKKPLNIKNIANRF